MPPALTGDRDANDKGDEESVMESLESVFNDGPEDEVIEQPAAVVEEAPIDPEPETVVKEEAETTSPEPDPEPQAQNVPLTALMAERDKRQALERQVAEFNANKAKEPAPDVFEDQVAYTQHMTQQMSDAMFQERASMSEFHARREFKDLDAKLEVFRQISADNPALQAQVQNSPSPFHEAYDIVAKHERLAKMENIDTWEANKTAELEAKIRAEYEGKQQADKQLRDSIPTSLVNEPSRGSIQKPTWNGPSPLSDIFGD